MRLPGLMDTATTTGVEHVTGAFGFWQVGGDEGTGVLLDVARAHGRSDTGTIPTGTLEMSRQLLRPGDRRVGEL